MKRPSTLLLGLAVAFASATPLLASPGPEVIPLPNGWQPEGITSGSGPTAYAGSLATGAVYEMNLITGTGEVVIDGQDDRIAVGLDFDERTGYLFVAGGDGGAGYVYDPATGELVAEYGFTAEPSFVNDVIITAKAAWFTDSFQPVLYRVPLGPGGALAGPAETVDLGGDFVFLPGEFNANGIEASPNGKALIVVHSALGTLYQVDPDTGIAQEIDLGGADVGSGDGILLIGRTLYVVQNFLNQIAVVALDARLESGEVIDTITHPEFDIPTTIADFANGLYAVNARFATPPEADTEYDVVRVRK